MFMDIKRYCESPTQEDKEWFGDLAGSNWLDTLHFAMENFKDESFISQFISPKLMRDFRLFAIEDDSTKPFINVSAIHDELGYRHIREQLSTQYNLSNLEPNIQVYQVDVNGDRSLTLRYYPQEGKPLASSKTEVLKHLHHLWKFDVYLEQENADGTVLKLSSCRTEHSST